MINGHVCASYRLESVRRRYRLPSGLAFFLRDVLNYLRHYGHALHGVDGQDAPNAVPR